jgi:serine protease AprX
MDYPVISSASLTGCWLNVTGYVGSAANQSAFANARVEFFKAAADSSGYGEGQAYLGALTTNASGNFSGIVSGNGFNASDRLTATATDSNSNTSEFGANFQVTAKTGACPTSPHAGAVRADQLWSTLQGQGITVAVVDSGINAHSDLQVGGGGNSRIVASTSVVPGTPADGFGHGTHVAGVIGGNGSASNGTRMGIAPGANLINVRVTSDTGMSLGSDLVAGLQWVYDNRATYNIKVVNVSMNSSVSESYLTSPIDAAVEILWFNGIVVVVSAGNNGGPGTLYPPANDPFVITVGAADDMGSASISDDAVASFSAYGTTENGFAKPDLVAPGRNLISLNASTSSNIYNNHVPNRVDNNYFRMSGTSMSAPVVSGAAALLLQDEPGLTPDQVKYRLKATASTSWPGYNATTAGAGYLDIYTAVNGTTTQSANTGIFASQLLSTGSNPISWGSVAWNSVAWNSVAWNSVAWNSVAWNSVAWNSVAWNSDYWGP